MAGRAPGRPPFPRKRSSAQLASQIPFNFVTSKQETHWPPVYSLSFDQAGMENLEPGTREARQQTIEHFVGPVYS